MYHFSIGVMLESFRTDIPNALKKAALLGAQGIQVYATTGELSPEMMTKEKRREFLKMVKDHGLIISALCGDLGHGFGTVSYTHLSYMKDFQPMTEREREITEKARKIFEAVPTVPCTSCAYCMKDCPASIAIYGTFQAINLYKTFENLEMAKGKYSWNTDGQGKAKASACIQCGRCEKVCPQHIHILSLIHISPGLYDRGADG